MSPAVVIYELCEAGDIVHADTEVVDGTTTEVTILKAFNLDAQLNELEQLQAEVGQPQVTQAHAAKPLVENFPGRA
jgi:hypothetical protein